MRPPPPQHPSDTTSPRYPNHNKSVMNNNNNNHQQQHSFSESSTSKNNNNSNNNNSSSSSTLPNVPEQTDDVSQQQYRSLTLEFTCVGKNNHKSKENVDVDTIRKVEANDGSLHLIATMPSSMVDGEQANLTAALLFEQIDQLATTTVVGSTTTTTYHVERVKINALQFNKEAIVGIQGFLSMYMDTIKHISLKDIVIEDCTPAEEEAFLDLCTIFQSCPLETLNLSDNMISAPIWKCWSQQSHLRQLILDFVEIPDDSLSELAQHFNFGDTLEELYVVLTNHIGPTGVIAANNVLKQCRCVGSLRWAVKDAPPDVLMPWRGLAQMAQEMIKNNNHQPSTLLHLVMDGGTISEDDCGVMGIGGALEHFTQLKTIKFRSIGLNDIGALHIANALCVAQSPLEVLDLSRNYIQYNGASSIAAMSEVPKIAANIKSLSLERNTIDAKGAIKLLSAYGNNGNQKLDLKLDGNPFNFSKVAYALAWQKGHTENTNDDSSSQVKNSGHNRNTSFHISNDVHVLRNEIKRLEDEKSILLQAFSVVGTVNHVVEHTRLLQRLSSVEKKVFGQSQNSTVIDNSGSNHRIEGNMDTSLQHRTTFSDHSSEPPMTPIGKNNRAMEYSNPQHPLMNHSNPLRSPMSLYNNTNTTIKNNKSSYTTDYWSASPVSGGGGYSCQSNPKKKVGGISGSETPNMYAQNSPTLNGYMKHCNSNNTNNNNNTNNSSSIRSSGGGNGSVHTNNDYNNNDDIRKSIRSTSSNVSNNTTTTSPRNPSPYRRR